LGPEDQPLDYNECLYLVAQYLLAQDWKLIPPEELARKIWQELQRRSLSGEASTEAVQSLAWQHYAVLLHDHCRQSTNIFSNQETLSFSRNDYSRSSDDLSSQAWYELKKWLERQAKFLTPSPGEPEVIVQEALFDLHLRLSEGPLKAPRTFLVYVLQALRRKNIDVFRQQSARKRGDEFTVYLEEMGTNPSSSEDNQWEDNVQPQGNETRGMENKAIREDVRERLSAFFRVHLASSLQVQVAEMHFLEGLSPAEIARLMGKQPHEIRMVKARIINSLRELPPDSLKQLLNILGSP
jgi:RNA polymerase sigma factor (sigma-70 family)